MKTKKDEIDQLLVSYEKAAAKRIAEQKRLDDEEKAKEKLFRVNLPKKITGVFQPVMLKLIGRLDKSLFKIETEKESGLINLYMATSKKEKHTHFWLAITDDQWDNVMVRFSYQYSLGEGTEEQEDLIMPLEKIDEAFITEKFMLCLRKICE